MSELITSKQHPAVQLFLAHTTTFRKIFKQFIGVEKIPTLSDEDAALAFVVAKKRAARTAEISKGLPPSVREKFSEMQATRTAHGLFFERFVFLKRRPTMASWWESAATKYIMFWRPGMAKVRIFGNRIRIYTTSRFFKQYKQFSHFRHASQEKRPFFYLLLKYDYTKSY